MVQSSVIMPRPEEALPGRAEPIVTDVNHQFSRRLLKGPYPRGMSKAVFAMGCFWGVERLFWQTRGVWVTAAGYTGGYTPNPTYEEVCTGGTGHAEAVQIIYDPQVVSYSELLNRFWENHDPTTGMRQGNDEGTQYRSAIFYTSPKQREIANWSKGVYAQALRDSANSHHDITTEILPMGPFYFADSKHQGYLLKNPLHYCGLCSTGTSFPKQPAPDDSEGMCAG